MKYGPQESSNILPMMHIVLIFHYPVYWDTVNILNKGMWASSLRSKTRCCADLCSPFLLSCMCQQFCFHSTDGWPGMLTVLCSALLQGLREKIPRGPQCRLAPIRGQVGPCRSFLASSWNGALAVLGFVFWSFLPTFTSSVQFGPVVSLLST